MATRNPRSFVSCKSEKTDQKEQKVIFLFLARPSPEVRPSTKNQAKTIKSGTLKEPHFLKTRQKFPKIQRTHKPSGTLRSLILPNVPAVFQGSREAYKPSGTPRVSFSQVYQRFFKDPEGPINPLAHQGSHSPKCTKVFSRIQRTLITPIVHLLKI